MKPKTTNEKTSGGASTLERVGYRLVRYRLWIMVALLAAWVAVRVSGFAFIMSSPLYYMYLWSESDNRFFDDWAKYLNRDWLNHKPLHHYHLWHQSFARYYFQKHPEKLQAILDANPDRDSTFIAGKELWNEWYKGNQYHQEPLYAYMLALFYSLNMNAIKAMIVLQLCLGVLTGAGLYFLSRRYFGEIAALITGIFYLFCGVLFIHELIILRTAWIIFLTILNVWLMERAFSSPCMKNFLLAGIGLGFSVLMTSIFSLYFYGTLVISFFLMRQQPLGFLKISMVFIAAFFLMRSPVIIRNIMVGAPALSTASGVESTFISSNAYDVNYVSGWSPVAERDAEILGETYNSLPRAVIATLKTHPSIGSYLSLLLWKAKAIWSGIERADNLNYYFYRQYVPALKLAFLDFFWLAPMGLAGLIFCIFQRKKYYGLYIAILANLLILMAFHVLGRYRAPLVALSLPLSAFALVECLRFFQQFQWKAAWKIAAVALLFYLSFRSRYADADEMLRLADFAALYDNYFLPELEKYHKAGQWDKILQSHQEFMNMQPEFISNLRADDMVDHENHIPIVQYFSQQRQIHGNIFKALGDEKKAALEFDKARILERVAENSNRHPRIP